MARPVRRPFTVIWICFRFLSKVRNSLATTTSASLLPVFHKPGSKCPRDTDWLSGTDYEAASDHPPIRELQQSAATICKGLQYGVRPPAAPAAYNRRVVMLRIATQQM